MPSSKITLEICTDSVEGARAAREGGADRVELCANLLEGGTTPSSGALELAVESCGLPVACMIRPRGGDFLYSRTELETMERDILRARDVGASAVVLGCLDSLGFVDEGALARLIDRARPLQVTFHRAFDVARDPEETLERLVSLGVDRILTSGQTATAEEGVLLLRRLVERAAGRITILAGCGVRAHNAARVVRETGVTELHATATEVRPSEMEFENPRVSMSSQAPLGGNELRLTSAERVRSLRAAIDQ